MSRIVSEVVSDSGFRITGTVLRIVATVFGIAAAYFLTIQSLRIELAAKAESSVVERLDKKITNIEVILKESMLSKDQFYSFSKDMETRLTRIETRLSEITGEESGSSHTKK